MGKYGPHNADVVRCFVHYYAWLETPTLQNNNEFPVPAEHEYGRFGYQLTCAPLWNLAYRGEDNAF